MLSPFLLIGVGGSGGKTLRAVRYALDMKLRLSGWEHGLPAAWQFLHFDTPLAQDGRDFPAPFLPQDSYYGLSAAHSSYENVITALSAQVSKQHLDHVLRQLPDPAEVTVPVQVGAGQYRAVGRAVVLARLQQVSAAVKLSLAKMNASDSLAMLSLLSDHLGGDPNQGAGTEPIVITVTSMAGGSGAGQYMDIIDAVKTVSGGAPWADNTYAILYAPDVFDGISGTSGVSSNALATISEATGGYWNNQTNDSVRSLFASQGLTISIGGANNRIGARYPLIVGREGATTSFKGQHDVYLSIASTLAAWVSEEIFQDSIGAYVKGNWDKSGARDVLPDETLFAQARTHIPPFAAIGFGRITLAREKFIDYSKERFVRSAVDRLLKAHVIDQNDPQFERNDNQGYIDESVENLRISFFEDTGLDEESEEKNMIIDALRAGEELDALAGSFRVAVRDLVSQSLDKKTGGLDSNQWIEQLLYARESLKQDYLATDANNRRRKFNQWVDEAPNVLLATVARYSIEYGMPVTEGLLSELIASLNRAVSELETEAANAEGWLLHLRSTLVSVFADSAHAKSIRPGSDVVNHAEEWIGESLKWESEAPLRRDASRLLREAIKDLLEPLRDFISGTHRTMAEYANSDRTADGLENDFKKWPGFDSSEVPLKYHPASNEKMLLEATDFPFEFERLIKQTMDDKIFLPAFRNAMREMLSEDRERNLTPLLTFVDPWVPSLIVGGVGGDRRVAQKPKFNMPNEPEKLKERAELWMKKPGTAFGSFLTITIQEYLDEKTLSPEEYKKRKDKFLTHLRSAYSASSPLVKLNETLLNQIHGKAVGQSDTVIMTPIPFSPDSDMYEPTKQILMSFMPNSKDKETTVTRNFSDKPASSIEFFQIMGHGVLPVVINSVMAPAAADWAKVSVKESSRTAFWQWKRARLLAEAVPMDAEALNALISGWYVAKAFGQIQRKMDNEELGPKLAVKAKDGSSLWFPHPLLYAGRLQEFDYLGAIVESTIVVAAIANANSSIEPYKPFQRLIELGCESKSLAPELEHWLDFGVGLEAKPGTGAVSGMPGANGSIDDRKELLRSHIKAELASLEGTLEHQNQSTNVYERKVIWELLPQVRHAINSLVHNINDRVPPTDGGGFEDLE